jgi:hypothetical protein
MKPSHQATYERARSLARDACFAVALQCRRIAADEPWDVYMRHIWADFQFLLVALTRTRRAAGLAAKVPEIAPAIEAAIKTFDATLPYLKTMRDVAEHIDDYAVDDGRHAAVERQALGAALFAKKRIEWLGFTLDTDEARQACEALFQAIKFNPPNKAN